MSGRSRGAVLVLVFVMAVLFNYLWELAQSPLYAGLGSFTTMWWHCFVASLGDGLLTLLIVAAGWMTLRRASWFLHPGVRGYTLMLTVGLLIGVSVEWVAVYMAGRWTYSAQMPLVPGLGVGLIPVAQMLLLPPLVFRVVALWYGRSSEKKSSMTS